MAWLHCGPASLLHAVQTAGLFSDSKHFVDMPLKPHVTPASLEEAWQRHQRSFPPPPPPPRVRGAHPKTEAPGLEPGTRPGLQAYKIRLAEFVDTHFDQPGSDLVTCELPRSCQATPAWLTELPDPSMAKLGAHVHGLWGLLYRQVAPSVHSHSQRHTLLPLPLAFIVPGDRFRECYNWDSFWVVRGLLASDARAAARDQVFNLLSLVDTVGHIPNGSRTYYRNRSQPPLISAMVIAAAGLSTGRPDASQPQDALGNSGSNSSTGRGASNAHSASKARSLPDMELLRFALPRLISTWQLWTSGSKAVLVEHHQGQHASIHALSRYYVDWQQPRPESYREDLAAAVAASTQCTAGTSSSIQQEAPGVAQTDSEDWPDGPCARQLWVDIASAAESGWDFSSRWQGDVQRADSIRTTQIVPADLNAFLYMLARDIAAIATVLGQDSTAQQFNVYAAQRLDALQQLMWSEQDGCWHDLLLCPPSQTSSCGTAQQQRDGQQQQQQQHSTSEGASSSGDHTLQTHPQLHSSQQLPTCAASNWVPLWTGCCTGRPDRAVAAVDGLKRSGLLQRGGILTTTLQTGEQWDAPNAWPPLQHMLIEGVAGSGCPGGAELAQQLAGSWLASNWAAYSKTGQMHEKYDAFRPGEYGGGGEYAPQVGFGWTNGVLLDLLHQGYRSF